MRLTFFQNCFAFALLTLSLTLSAFVLNRQEEYGKAGYYADSLNGRKTASGEVYDKTAFTCAHKSLPFGTKVRVTRLDNKKSVIVKVNDRGPYAAGYVTDLSRAAAESIDLVKSGVAQVKLEVVETADGSPASANAPTQLIAPAKASPANKTAVAPGKATPASKPATTLLIKAKNTPTAAHSTDPKPASSLAATQPKSTPSAKKSELYKVGFKSAPKKGFGVQLTNLTDADNVWQTVIKLEETWPGKSVVDINHDDPSKLYSYKILLGPFPDRKSAEAQQKVAQKKGYPQCFVVDLSGI
jgi:rare lipoprotein A